MENRNCGGATSQDETFLLTRQVAKITMQHDDLEEKLVALRKTSRVDKLEVVRLGRLLSEANLEVESLTKVVATSTCEAHAHSSSSSSSATSASSSGRIPAPSARPVDDETIVRADEVTKFARLERQLEEARKNSDRMELMLNLAATCIFFLCLAFALDCRGVLDCLLGDSKRVCSHKAAGTSPSEVTGSWRVPGSNSNALQSLSKMIKNCEGVKALIIKKQGGVAPQEGSDGASAILEISSLQASLEHEREMLSHAIEDYEHDGMTTFKELEGNQVAEEEESATKSLGDAGDKLGGLCAKESAAVLVVDALQASLRSLNASLEVSSALLHPGKVRARKSRAGCCFGCGPLPCPAILISDGCSSPGGDMLPSGGQRWGAGRL